jgi:hypothetical protein
LIWIKHQGRALQGSASGQARRSKRQAYSAGGLGGISGSAGIDSGETHDRGSRAGTWLPWHNGIFEVIVSIEQPTFLIDGTFVGI